MSELSSSFFICLGSRAFGQDFLGRFSREILAADTKVIPILLAPSVPGEGKEEFANG